MVKAPAARNALAVAYPRPLEQPVIRTGPRKLRADLELFVAVGSWLMGGEAPQIRLTYSWVTGRSLLCGPPPFSSAEQENSRVTGFVLATATVMPQQLMGARHAG
jgi:hypothetical protein